MFSITDPIGGVQRPSLHVDGQQSIAGGASAEDRFSQAIENLRNNPPPHMTEAQVMAAIARLQGAAANRPASSGDFNATATVNNGSMSVGGSSPNRPSAFDSQGRPTQIDTPTQQPAQPWDGQGTAPFLRPQSQSVSLPNSQPVMSTNGQTDNRPSVFTPQNNESFSMFSNAPQGGGGSMFGGNVGQPSSGQSGTSFGGNIGGAGQSSQQPPTTTGNGSTGYSGTSPGQQPTDLGMYNVNSTAHFQTNLDSPGPSRVMNLGQHIQQGLNSRNGGDPYSTGMFSEPVSGYGSQPQSSFTGGSTSSTSTSQTGQYGGPGPSGGADRGTAPEDRGNRFDRGNETPTPDWLEGITSTRDAQAAMEERLRGIGSQVAQGRMTNEQYRAERDRMLGDIQRFNQSLEAQSQMTQSGGGQMPEGMSTGPDVSFEWGPDGGPEFLGDVPNVPGPTFWDVTGDELVEDRLAGLFEAGSPVLEAYQNATERAHLAAGGQNSLMARQAGVAALSQMAFNIASQDAQTIARSREFNAAMSNQFGLAQQTFIYNALLSDQNFRQGMEMQRAQLAAQANIQASAAAAASRAQTSAQNHQMAMAREAMQHSLDMANLQHGQALEIMGAEYGLMMDRDTLNADLNLRNQYTLNEQGFGQQYALNDQSFLQQYTLNDQGFRHNSSLQSQANQEQMQRMGYEAQLGEWRNSIDFSRQLALMLPQTQTNLLGMWTEGYTNIAANGGTPEARAAFTQDFQNMVGAQSGLSTSFFTNGANPYVTNYAYFPPPPGTGSRYSSGSGLPGFGTGG